MGRDVFQCADAEKFVHVFLDGEFAQEDRRAFEEHLRECARCRTMVDFEQKFRQALRESISQPPLPAGLEERIWAALDAEDDRQQAAGRARVWAVSALAAAAVAAVVSLGVVSLMAQRRPESGKPAPDTARVARPVVSAGVRRPLPVRALSARRPVGDMVMPASVTGPGRAAVSVQVVDPDVLSDEGFVGRWVGGRKVYFGMKNGRNVALFVHDDGRVYAVSADLPEEELAEIVQSLVEH